MQVTSRATAACQLALHRLQVWDLALDPLERLASLLPASEPAGFAATVSVARVRDNPGAPGGLLSA